MIGDQVLVATAAVFADQSRIYDLSARFGGEELILLLPETSLVDAMLIAERIRSAVSDIKISSSQKRTSMSFGVASWRPGETPGAFLARADAALYQAKRSDRNRVNAELVFESAFLWARA